MFTIDDLLPLHLLATYFQLCRLIVSGTAQVTPWGYSCLISQMVSDVVAETEKRVNENNIQRAEDVRALSYSVAEFSSQMQESHLALKEFLHARCRHSGE